MPRGDGTGPNALGAKTGRGRNNCGQINIAGNGYGRGFGRGLYRGTGYYATNRNVDEQEFLKQEKKALEERINFIDTKLTK